MRGLAHLETTGDVNQRVDAAEGLERLLREALHIRCRRHVAGQQQVLRIFEARKDFGQAACLMIYQSKTRRPVDEMLCNRTTQRACGTGDQDMGSGASVAHGNSPG